MELKNKKLFLGLTLLTCFIFGVFLVNPLFSFLSSAGNSMTYFSSPDNIYMGGGIPVYVREATAVVVAQVRKVTEPYLLGKGIHIQQDAWLDIKEVLKGDPQMNNIKVTDLAEQMEGFSIDGGAPSFKNKTGLLTSGEKVLLFLGMTSMGDYVVFGGPYGKYLIDQNNDVSHILDKTMSLQEVKSKIKNLLKDPLNDLNVPPFTFDQYIDGYSQYAVSIVMGTVVNDDLRSAHKTAATIAVTDILKGSEVKSGSEIDVYKPSSDDMGPYVLTFRQNEKILLFLRKTEAGNFEVVPGQYGKFVIDEKNKATALDKTSLDLDELRSKIQNGLSATSMNQ